MIRVLDIDGRELADWRAIPGPLGHMVLVDQTGRACMPERCEWRRLVVIVDDERQVRALRASGYDVDHAYPLICRPV